MSRICLGEKVMVVLTARLLSGVSPVAVHVSVQCRRLKFFAHARLTTPTQSCVYTRRECTYRRVVGLENRRPFTGLVSSNLTLSASQAASALSTLTGSF